MTISASDLINFSVKSSMTGTYSATIEATNQADQYTEAMLQDVLTLTLNCAATYPNVTGDGISLTGNKTWVNGIIAGMSLPEGISLKTVSFTLKSFFARLAKRALNTESFKGISADTALETILEEYLGVPPTLCDIDASATILTQGAHGNNALDELRWITQAGKSALFVSESGILRAAPWKDANSAVDVVIPKQAVKSATPQRNTEIPSTVIRIRGAWINTLEQGEVPFSNSRTGSGKGGKSNGRGGNQVQCAKIGIPVEDIAVEIKDMIARGEDLKNAEIVVDGVVVNGINYILDGAISVNVTNGAGFFAQGDHVMEIGLKGRKGKDDNKNNAVLRNKEAVDPVVARKWLAAAAALGARRNAGGGPAGGGGAIGGAGNRSSDKPSDEAVEVQVEMQVVDPDLYAEYGVIEEQIENLYVSSKEALTDIVIRRFQEIKMNRKSWKVELSYVPGIELGDVVTFTTPATDNSPSKTITGLLSALDMSYDSTPVASMNITVESFEDIGATNYIVQNMIQDPEMVGEGDDGEWSTYESAALVKARVSRAEGYLTVTTAGQGTITLTRGDMEVGADYVISFNVEEEDGTEDLTFSIKDSSGTLWTTTYTGSDTESHQFTCRQATTTFEWDLQATSGTTIWTFNTPILKKLKTA